jgi:hypothetical protein
MERLIDGKDALSIENTLDRDFEVMPALAQIYALRYQVYCVEHPFEDPAKHPVGCETDCHDPFSLHAALVYRPSHEPVGFRELCDDGAQVGRWLKILDSSLFLAGTETLTRGRKGAGESFHFRTDRRKK